MPHAAWSPWAVRTMRWAHSCPSPRILACTSSGPMGPYGNTSRRGRTDLSPDPTHCPNPNWTRPRIRGGRTKPPALRSRKNLARSPNPNARGLSYRGVRASRASSRGGPATSRACRPGHKNRPNGPLTEHRREGHALTSCYENRIVWSRSHPCRMQHDGINHDGEGRGQVALRAPGRETRDHRRGG